jgi:hypothetical protein
LVFWTLPFFPPLCGWNSMILCSWSVHTCMPVTCSRFLTWWICREVCGVMIWGPFQCGDDVLWGVSGQKLGFWVLNFPIRASLRFSDFFGLFILSCLLPAVDSWPGEYAEKFVESWY